MFASRRFDGNKCKVQLKMLINRFNLLTQKKANLAKQQKRQVALLLRDEKEANARILVEHIIREDYTLESYELLKQHTELLVARLNVIITESELKPEVSEAVCALLYAGYLMGTEVPELKQLQIIFTQKYGKEYAQEVINNKEKYLDHRLVKMLTNTQVPDPSVINLYLTEIAKAYGVQYTPRADAAPQPISSTIGVPLPMPGMPTSIPAPISPEDLNSPQSPATPASTAPPGQASIPVAQFLPPSPIAVPVAQPIGQPPSQPMGVPQPFSVTLTKGPAGLGLTLDPHNVVTTVKPGTEAEACGQIQPGDLVLSLNGIPVSDNHPVKSVAIDIEDGAPGTFVFLRNTPSSPAVTASPVSADNAAQPSCCYPPMASEPPMQFGTTNPNEPATPGAGGDEEDDVLAKRLEMLRLPRH